MFKPELLLPAGNIETFSAAIEEVPMQYIWD
jgi:collagenase-like PrtC family protease